MSRITDLLKKHKRWLKPLGITCLSIIGLWIVLLVVLQIVLTPAFLGKMADKYAKQYIDADVQIGRIEASVIRSFPDLNLEIDGLTITYPHDRFAAYDTVGAHGVLRDAGRAEEADTLAAFNKLSLSVNYVAALTGKIRILDASLDKPKIYAHSFSDEDANWNILKNISTSEDDTDTTATPLPAISVKHVALTGRPRVVYTSCQDTIFAGIFLKQMIFKGRLTTAANGRNRLGLNIDSLFVSGRLPADTIAVAVEKFRIAQHGKHMDLGAQAKAFLGMSEYGRIILPIGMKGRLEFPHSDVLAVNLSKGEFDLATLKMTADAKVKVYSDSIYVKANANIDKCKVKDLIDLAGKNFFPQACDLETDAAIYMDFDCDGYYNSSRNTLPDINANFRIPRAYLKYPDVPDGELKTSIAAKTDNGRLNIGIKEMCMIFAGLDFDLTGDIYDLIGEDPLFDLNGTATADLGEMCSLLPDSLGINVTGDVDANINGTIRMSQMDLHNFYKAELDGCIKSDFITVSMPNDTIDAEILAPHIDIKTIPGEKVGAQTLTRMLTVSMGVDSVIANMGASKVKATDLYALVRNSEELEHEEFGKERHPILGKLKIGSLRYIGEDSLMVGIKNSVNNLKLAEAVKGSSNIPLLTVSSENERIGGRQGVNRFGVKNASFSAVAMMRGIERAQKRKHFLDSLEKVYPGVPRDSLIFKVMRNRRPDRPMPDFLKEKDFQKGDIDISLNETMAKYVREWNLNGNINIEGGIVITPYFPLHNRIANIKGRFSNDRITLDNFMFLPGKSDLSASGKLSGLEGAMLRHAPMKLDLNLTSERIDANELLTAYNAGAKFEGHSEASTMNVAMSDDEYLAAVAVDTTAAADSTYALIIVPANLIANINLQAHEVDYSDLNINWLTADLNMKERCVQLTNAIATSNMGDISFEGFYATRSKSDIKAGFDLNLSDITADKVVQLFPAVDSIIPMLTSFKGLLNCEMAATTDLDTNMNFITQSMSGIMKINGRDLEIEENDAYRKLAKMLMFKNKKVGKIDDMSVSGLIGNNKLEIFPFVLKIDRYTLAMSGLQNFDQTFKYHVSVIKSPIPFRFGINIFGDFDKWKFRLGKAKYKNTNVPVFTAQIDTLQMNLVSSIHNIFTKGVDLAVAQNRNQRDSIDARKVRMGYNPDAPLDSLDAGEMAQMDSLRTAYDNPVDSLINAKIDAITNSTTTPVDTTETDSKLQALIDRKLENADSRKEARAARKAEKQANKEAKKAEKEAIKASDGVDTEEDEQ